MKKFIFLSIGLLLLNDLLAQTYMPISGGTFTGNVTFANATTLNPDLLKIGIDNSFSGNGNLFGSISFLNNDGSDYEGLIGFRNDDGNGNGGTNDAQFELYTVDNAVQNLALKISPDGKTSTFRASSLKISSESSFSGNGNLFASVDFLNYDGSNYHGTIGFRNDDGNDNNGANDAQFELYTVNNAVQSLAMKIAPNLKSYFFNEMTVVGTIRSEEVKVEIIHAPDYVFEPDYKLRTLKETKEYISENKHLPEIPPAIEMEEKGVELGDMNMRLLKKIEELTLYQIQLMEEMEAMKKELQELKVNE